MLLIMDYLVHNYQQLFNGYFKGISIELVQMALEVQFLNAII